MSLDVELCRLIHAAHRYKVIGCYRDYCSSFRNDPYAYREGPWILRTWNWHVQVIVEVENQSGGKKKRVVVYENGRWQPGPWPRLFAKVLRDLKAKVQKAKEKAERDERKRRAEEKRDQQKLLGAAVRAVKEHHRSRKNRSRKAAPAAPGW